MSKTKKSIGRMVLESYERSIYDGANVENSLVMEVIDNKRTQRLVDKVLSSKVEVENDDGGVSEFTLEEMVVMKAVEKELNESEGFKSLMNLQRMRGELQEIQEVNISLVNRELESRAITNDDDDPFIREIENENETK